MIHRLLVKTQFEGAGPEGTVRLLLAVLVLVLLHRASDVCVLPANGRVVLPT